MTKVKILIGIFVLIFIGFIFVYRADPASAQFDLLLKESHQSVLDLRKLDAINWDELVFLNPYSNICDYNINKYEKNGPNCWSSIDDGECYILLLLENSLVSKIKIDRKKIDLTKADIQNRVLKEKAVFQFTSQGDWPSVKLASEQ